MTFPLEHFVLYLFTVINHHHDYSGAAQVALLVKNVFATAGDIKRRVLSLGWKDPLEEDMATHFSILAWRIPWTEEPGGLQSTG